MNRKITSLLVFIYLLLAACTSFADTMQDAGLEPLTPKEAMFTGENPDGEGAPAVTATDAGLAAEEAGEEASSQAAVEGVDSAMDVGMDY